MLDNFIKIGYISKTHGYKGEVKVIPLTSDINRFNLLKTVYIKINNNYTLEEIESVRLGYNYVLIKFKKYNSKEEIFNYISCYLFVKREDAIPLKEGEYYTQDLIGCVVYYNNNKIGKIINVENFGSSDLFLIQYKNKTVYYPFLKQYIENVDINNKKIIINQFEGFFD